MAKMFNRARMSVTSTGTGTLTLGGAVLGYQSFATAGVANGDVVSYTIEDGANFEFGTGTYTSAGTTLSRTVTQSYNGTTYGTSPISVTTSAQVFITALAADLTSTDNITSGTLPVARGGTGVTTSTGSGSVVLSTSPTLVTPALGTPASGNLANCTFPTLNQNTTGTASNVTGTVAVANGGTGLTSLTAGRIPYGNGTGAFSNSANLTFSSNNLNILGTSKVGTGTGSLSATFGIINTVGSVTGFQLFQEGVESWIIGMGSSSAALTFGNSGTERMRIDSSGNVGIGTTPSSGVRLDVRDNSGFAAMQLAGTGIGTSQWTSDGALNVTIKNVSAGALIFGTNNTERMRIDSSGNLGLGVTPVTKLQVKGALNQNFAISGSVSFANSVAISGINDAGSANIPIEFRGAGFQWYNSGSLGMALDTSGNLGIGTSSPSSYGKLAVYGASGGVSARVISQGGTVSDYAQQILVAGSSLTHNINMLVYGDGSGNYHYSTAPFNFGTSSSNPLIFVSNSTERARIDSSGNVLVGGTAARGTTAGTAHLDLFNGTAPAGTLTNGISLYSSSGDFNFMDASGNGYKVGFRNIPQNAQTSAYVAVVGDVGKHISITTGGVTVNASVFSAGDVFTIYNNSGSSQNITAGASVTFRLAGTSTSGTPRAIAQYGLATVLCVTGGATPTFVISGAGVT